ncbi:MAG: hypothetical protein CMN30_22270 [Sandaracinus sp.]|nr:hypothetical protein [Sandaracinus sp.]|tara:strand:+ start:215 stop:955 length:741 start_codon:yes stop_codon:yes gene_type:complete
MSERPMHTIPGLFDRLAHLYADGERAVAEGRLADAEAAFGQIIELDDHFRQRYVTAYAQRAFVRHRMGRLEEAVADYTKALAAGEPEPNQAQYHFQRAMALSALKRPADAEAGFSAAIALAPNQPGPWHLRGKLRADSRPAEALADLDRFLQLADHPEVRQLRGYCLLQLGRAPEAIPELNRASAGAWTDYLRAWAHAITGNVDQSLQAMAACVTANGSFGSYFRELDDFASVRQHPGFAAAVPPA